MKQMIQNKIIKILLGTGIILILVMSLLPDNPISGINWMLMSVIIVMFLILFAFYRFEKGNANPKDMALIATMASVAGISRIPFAAIMSVQPTTFIVMITGYVFGSQTGFVVGAVAALVSNFFLGQGPWTPWQMFSWGCCGLIAGLLGRFSKEFNIIPFSILCGLSGYMFGWFMNIWHWVGFVYPLSYKTFIATYISSFPFDTLHAVGNILFAILFGKSFYMILMRFKRRMTLPRSLE